MQVARLGHSLAALLPATVVEALELKKRDDIEVHVANRNEPGAARPASLAEAPEVVTRTRGMKKIAARAGLPRDNFYRTLSVDGNPELPPVFEIVNAWDLRLGIRTRRAGTAPA